MVCLLGIVLPAAFAEKVYRSVDGQGVVEFSDQSKQGAEELNVRDTPTYKAIKVKPTSSPAPSRGTASSATQQIQIVSPTAKETIHSNPGNMTVVVSLPQLSTTKGSSLKQGQKIALSLDGKVIRQTDQKTIELNNVDRGTHHLKVVLIDVNGKPLSESPTVEFYMKRFSKYFKPPKKPVAPK